MTGSVYSSLYQCSNKAEDIPLAKVAAIIMNERMDSSPMPDSP